MTMTGETTPARTLPFRTMLLAFVAVALVQSAVLGWMVFNRVRLLSHGREIVLPIVPVDPRSLFRGDYVDLAYEITRVPLTAFPPDLYPPEIADKPGRQSTTRSQIVHVTLEQGGDGSWKPVAVSPRPPQTGGEANRIVLKGRLDPNWWAQSKDRRVRYGIESYFVPEGKGLELEKLARDKKMSAVVAVSKTGEAAIKGLIIDGVRRYDEPLF